MTSESVFNARWSPVQKPNSAVLCGVLTCPVVWQFLQATESAHWAQVLYRGADKSLARPGRKQATATEDFEFHISYL